MTPKASALYTLTEGSPSQREVVRGRLPQLDLLSSALGSLAVTAWVTVWTCSDYELLDEMPYSASAPAYSLMSHTEEVASVGLMLGEYAVKRWRTAIQEDVLLAALLLHDLDKGLLYRRAGDGSVTVDEAAAAVGHGPLGASILRDLGCDADVVNAVACHSPSSPLSSASAEAWILHYADLFAADHVFRGVAGVVPFYRRPHGASVGPQGEDGPALA